MKSQQLQSLNERPVKVPTKSNTNATSKLCIENARVIHSSTHPDHPRPPAERAHDPVAPKPADSRKIISFFEFDYKNSQCLTRSKKEDLATPNPN